jgi:amino acid transporter
MVMVFGGFSAFIHKFDTSAFITTYFPIPFFLVLLVGYKLWHKTKVYDLDKLDFVTGSSIEVPEKVRLLK